MKKIRWYHSFRDGLASKDVESAGGVYNRFDDLGPAVQGPAQRAVFTTSVVASVDELDTARQDFELFYKSAAANLSGR